MFLFQFESREAGFVVTDYNQRPTPEGKRFCTGMMFTTRADASKYLAEKKEIMKQNGLEAKAAGDSIISKWKAHENAAERLAALDRKYKFMKVTFDIAFGSESAVMWKVYSAREVRGVQYMNDTSFKGRKVPAGMA